MKKIITLVLLFFIPLSLPLAKTEITQSDFKTYMQTKGYSVGDLELGSVASDDEYNITYINYNNNEEANNKFKELYESVINSPSVTKISDFNLDDFNNEFSMIEYKMLYEENGYEKYTYVYRIQSSVIYGICSMKNSQVLKETIDGLLDDSIIDKITSIKKEEETKDKNKTENKEENSNNNKKVEEKSNNNINNINIILTIIIVIAVIILIGAFLKILKK